MDFKSFSDGLDKLTDILNVGRLVFYTAAGFCLSLPLAMTLRLLAQPRPAQYWTQFLADATACARHPGLWAFALVLGFLVASVAFALVDFAEPARRSPETDGYNYQYPRLFSGGMPDKTSAKDYAAWLISEYYRYYEITVYIPYAIRLSLPIYAAYTLIFLLRSGAAAAPAGGLSLGAGHVALGLWALVAGLVWHYLWFDFWLPKVAHPIYDAWVVARREAIAGLQAFVGEAGAKPPPPAEP
jgi:hypothetical protein